MCQYWKKQHTCNHPSDRPYIEMCRPGFLSNTVCPDIGDDLTLRPSHFPCWNCIKAAGREEKLQTQLLATAAESARSTAAKENLAAEKRAREERVRQEAREKAERERATDHKMRVEMEREAEWARREGGPWVLAEAGSGKKKKGKGNGNGGGGSASPASPSVSLSALKKDAWKENGKAVGKEERSVGGSGRAGHWGPKKILSRKEGGGVLGDRVDASIDTNDMKQ